jgi:hypothetical protein
MSVDKGRFARVLVLISFVTAVILLTTAQRFGTGGRVFPVAVVAVGTISLVTAITGFLIAAAEGLES